VVPVIGDQGNDVIPKVGYHIEGTDKIRTYGHTNDWLMINTSTDMMMNDVRDVDTRYLCS
jgi:hypothetical protein